MTVNAVRAFLPAGAVRSLPAKNVPQSNGNTQPKFGEVGLLEVKRHRQALFNTHDSIDQLSGELKDVAMKGRELFLAQACHQYRHTDDGAKLMLALAFSRALQDNRIPRAMNGYMMTQVKDILKFPELDEQLKKLDKLGTTMVEIFSGTPKPAPIKEESRPSFRTEQPLKVEFVDDDDEEYKNMKIVYSVPVTPLTRLKALSDWTSSR